MKIGVTRLIEDLRASGQTVEGPLQSNGREWVIVNDYIIPGGRFVGQGVRIAVPVTGDYPSVPPGGLYVCPCLIPAGQMGSLNVHDHAAETVNLPGQWQYWSRPVPPNTWNVAKGAKRLIAHWNAVFCNVN